MANPILIIHGWSDNYESFLPLKAWLNDRGYPAQQVFFGNYESMEDHVTFDDLAIGLQTRFEEMQKTGALPHFAPFSLDVIVHSTGAPVVRHWLEYHLSEICKGDMTRCPIRLEFDQTNEQFYSQERQKPDVARVHAYQQFLVHVRDELENDVLDYRLDFHITDFSITRSAWSDTPGTLTKLRQYQKYTQFLQEQVIADVQPYSVNPSYRTFFINLDRLKELQGELEREPNRPYIAMNLDATGLTRDLTYDTDALHYLPVQPPIPDDQRGMVDFFKANTSTLVEIVLERVPSRNVADVVWGTS